MHWSWMPGDQSSSPKTAMLQTSWRPSRPAPARSDMIRTRLSPARNASTLRCFWSATRCRCRSAGLVVGEAVGPDVVDVAVPAEEDDLLLRLEQQPDELRDVGGLRDAGRVAHLPVELAAGAPQLRLRARSARRSSRRARASADERSRTSSSASIECGTRITSGSSRPTSLRVRRSIRPCSRRYTPSAAGSRTRALSRRSAAAAHHSRRTLAGAEDAGGEHLEIVWISPP
jgi:hypothetical protein